VESLKIGLLIGPAEKKGAKDARSSEEELFSIPI
jgi:hypothetical protein